MELAREHIPVIPSPHLIHGISITYPSFVWFIYSMGYLMYMYSHPEVDRISEIFKKDFFFKKIVGIFSKPSVFTRFSSLLSHF